MLRETCWFDKGDLLGVFYMRELIHGLQTSERWVGLQDNSIKVLRKPFHENEISEVFSGGLVVQILDD